MKRAGLRSEEADAACDRATARMLTRKPDSLGGLVEKAHCVRWRMEDQVDAALMGGLIGDMVRVAGCRILGGPSPCAARHPLPGRERGLRK